MLFDVEEGVDELVGELALRRGRLALVRRRDEVERRQQRLVLSSSACDASRASAAPP
jgi:hypothetical protein